MQQHFSNCPPTPLLLTPVLQTQPPCPCPSVTFSNLAVANVIMAMPAAAEAGKLFDFNLTLPIMAGEILLLMVFLDKFWFGPVGKVRGVMLSWQWLCYVEFS
jgi:hypothetical protein